MKVCEMCESDNYCKHCGTCHDCLSESIDSEEKQLAAANEENSALKTYASRGDEEIKSLNEQLAAYEKAIAWHVNHTNEMHKEIAEYRDALDKLLDEARSSADQVHHEFGLGEQVYDKSITTAEKLLAKHKESK